MNELFSIYLSLAHGFGSRIDLPIPLDLYIKIAIVIVGLSFFLISFLSEEKFLKFKNYPKVNLSILKILTLNPILFLIKIISIAFLIILILASFFGNQDPILNLAPTTVWVLFGVGLTILVTIFGNIWTLINPWKNLFEISRLPSLKVTYPKGLGVWPAVVIFFIYRFIENAVGTSFYPYFIGQMLIGYSLITFLGFFIFGVKNWLNFADPFGYLFKIISYFSLFEVNLNTKEIFLRPPLAGFLNLSEEKKDISEVVFIIFMLSTLSLDGLKEIKLGIDFFYYFYNLGLAPMEIYFLGMQALFFGFLLIYLIFCYLIKLVSRYKGSVLEISTTFIYSLLPIAIVYEISHYIVLLVTEGQRIFYLVLDPFGFSQIERVINYSTVNFLAIWNFQALLIVLGHIASIYLAHFFALKLFKDSSLAARSQYPMLILMIGYTIFSLWILAQPLIAEF